MASFSFTHFSLLPRICRLQLNGNIFPYMNFVQIQDCRVNRKVVMAVSRNKIIDSLAQEVSDGEGENVGKKTRAKSKRASTRTRKKVIESPDKNSAVDGIAKDEEILAILDSNENTKKTRIRTPKKAPSTSDIFEVEEATEKVTRRKRTKKKHDDIDNIQENEIDLSDHEGDTFTLTIDDDNEQDLEFDINNGEDISYTYGWPPLVCCFGAAQYAFVPAGKRANRLIDCEMHERKRDALWEPEKFVRACGGCSSNVAIALASLGGKVAFMGKLGDDDYGESLLYYLNVNNVQTRAVKIDGKRATAVSCMKIGKKGGLRMNCVVKSCAEDCLSGFEINIDVLKEAKMFYFNTFSLLDRNMRSSLLQAIKISKKLGNIVFFDLNLPLPLWQSSEETKMFIKSAWHLSDIIEVTKQELDFLCGITPSENFDTRVNDRSKFTHYAPEVVSQLWHDNLKVLFVTNGTSKIHFYTKEHNGFVHGMEDAPLTPYTADMSASGDGIIAGIMRMLSVQPHLITDKGYLERTLKYAVSCGVIDQWLMARRLGFPVKEGLQDLVASDPNGIKSLTEREFRTLVPSST